MGLHTPEVVVKERVEEVNCKGMVVVEKEMVAEVSYKGMEEVNVVVEMEKGVEVSCNGMEEREVVVMVKAVVVTDNGRLAKVVEMATAGVCDELVEEEVRAMAVVVNCKCM